MRPRPPASSAARFVAGPAAPPAPAGPAPHLAAGARSLDALLDSGEAQGRFRRSRNISISFAFSSPWKILKNMSSSDRFPLKPALDAVLLDKTTSAIDVQPY